MSGIKLTLAEQDGLIKEIIENGQNGDLEKLLEWEIMRKVIAEKWPKIEHILDQWINQVDLYKFYWE